MCNDAMRSFFLKHIWECWPVHCHSVITWETCFDKSEVLKDFISDVSKSWGDTCFAYEEGRPMNRGRGRVIKARGGGRGLKQWKTPCIMSIFKLSSIFHCKLCCSFCIFIYNACFHVWWNKKLVFRTKLSLCNSFLMFWLHSFPHHAIK